MASFGTQLAAIYKRTNLVNNRNPIVFRGRFASAVMLGLISGLVWFQISDDPFNTRGTQDRLAALFFLCMNQFQQSFNPVIITFPLERAIFLREQNSGLYGVYAYYIARIFPETLMAIFFPCILTPITYFLVGLSTTQVSSFFINLLFCIMVSLCGNAMAILLGCLTSDVKVASGLAPLFFLPLLMCSGFYSNIASLPLYTRWVNYIDPFGYAFNAVLHNEFDDKYTLMDPLRVVNPPTGIWDSLLYLFIIILFFRMLGLLALRLSITKVQN